MEDLDLTGLRVFREVVESGSFTGAADRLGITASMVSKHVARLERKLGARLLNRTSRRMSLTEAGALFHDQSRQALDALDAAVASVGQTEGPPRGELKVSAPVWFATPRFARLLAAYRQECPEVRVDMHLDNHLVDIVAGGFDLALRTTRVPAPNLIARRLCAISLYLVATPACVQQARLQAPPEGPHMPGLIVPNYLQLDRLQSAEPQIHEALKRPAVLRTNDSTLSYHAVHAGMGAAWLPAWLVEQDVAAGRLQILHGQASTFSSSLFAVYTSRRHLPPKLRSFIDFLSARMDMMDDPAAA